MMTYSLGEKATSSTVVTEFFKSRPRLWRWKTLSMISARRFHWTKDKTKRERTITVLNSWHFIAGPAEQESGADWRAVAGVHPLRSSASHGALFQQLNTAITAGSPTTRDQQRQNVETARAVV